MLRMPNRIRGRLLLSYLFLSLNMILLAGITFYYFKRAESLRNSQSTILEIDLKLQKLINTDLLIIDRETARNDFFHTGKSHLLTEHQDLVNEIKTMLYQIKEIEQRSLGENLFMKIDTTLVQYNNNFNQYMRIVFVRGFRDYGLEGKMRDKAHVLERMNIITREELLYLRRHEKDFFLRKDTTYLTKFNKLCDRLIAKNQHKVAFAEEQGLLESYCLLFNEIARIDAELGFSENMGIRKQLHAHVELLEKQFGELLSTSKEATERKLKRGELLFYISMAISIGLSILLSVYFSTQIANPVKKLARYMDNFVVGEDPLKLPDSRSYDMEEIQVLWQSFQHMSLEIKKQFAVIEEKRHLLGIQNDRLNKLNKELDQFIYSASHDLKAPLASLLGLINLLKAELKSNEHDEYIDLMEGSVKKLENHIKDIIQYSKNHQLDICRQEIKLKTKIEAIIDQLKYQKGAEAIQIQLDIKEKVTFYSDPMRMNMILFNLISNAFKYHDSTKAEQLISISCTVTAKAAFITVADNGMGIEEKHIEKIFDLFYRANEKSNGSGLGLFITKEACDKLGGVIKVKAEPGIGCAFTIILPNLYEEAPALSSYANAMASLL